MKTEAERAHRTANQENTQNSFINTRAAKCHSTPKYSIKLQPGSFKHVSVFACVVTFCSACVDEVVLLICTCLFYLRVFFLNLPCFDLSRPPYMKVKLNREKEKSAFDSSSLVLTDAALFTEYQLHNKSGGESDFRPEWRFTSEI